MIEYDNGDTFAILVRVSGSVLPYSIPVGIVTFAMGLTLTVLREHTDYMEKLGDDGDYIDDTFAIRTIAMVVGILLSFRANLALNRWMDGISEIQLMLSKWGDAFIALSGFFSNKKCTQEVASHILLFRIRVAHWFSLMSCLAFATVRTRTITTLDEIPIMEMFAERQSLSKSFACQRSKQLETIESSIGGDMDTRLRLLVLAAPTPQEVQLLDISTDKVNTVYLWIIQAISEEVRTGVLDTPPPIVSRVYQEVSNGKLGFTQAHKVAMVPFPFPFAQMVSLLLVVLYALLPFYIELFTRNAYFTPFLCLCIPICYQGLNQVAIELEEPFGTDWNDVDIEVRHEEFLWMLVDVLRQSTKPPDSQRAEEKITNGIVQNCSHINKQIPKYLEKRSMRSKSTKESDESKMQPFSSDVSILETADD